MGRSPHQRLLLRPFLPTLVDLWRCYCVHRWNYSYRRCCQLGHDFRWPFCDRFSCRISQYRCAYLQFGNKFSRSPWCNGRHLAALRDHRHPVFLLDRFRNQLHLKHQHRRMATSCTQTFSGVAKLISRSSPSKQSRQSASPSEPSLFHIVPDGS